ncbi:MAG: RtcB family protein [bacterium]|nr:RtcB family protein [bacterium]
MTCVEQWLSEPTPPEVARAIERLAAAPGVEHIAVMPDVHLATDVCVGTVLGTNDYVYPQAAGGDIGCGVAAVRIDAPAVAIDRAAAGALFAELRHRVPAIRHRRARDAPPQPLSDAKLARHVERDARVQLGTLGRGNHFVELQRDESGALWLTVHTGSRGLGPAVRDHHLARGGAEERPRGLVGLPVPGAGSDYVHDAGLAVEYAARNRRAIADAVEAALLAVLGVRLARDTWFETAHDTVSRETHDGRELWVHRKGANPAAVGQPAVIPGSMGTATYHVTGRGLPAALGSSSHGAGRALRRGIAARRFSARELTRQLRGVHFETDRAHGLRDEAPLAYKDIDRVMRAQRDLVRIERKLRPVLVFKAG